MKLNFTIDMDDYEYASDIESAITERAVDELVRQVLKDEYKYEFNRNVYTAMVGVTLKEKIETMFKEIKHELSNELLENLIKSVESKRDFQERVFKVKDFAELEKKNEEYLIELMSKVIAKRFK